MIGIEWIPIPPTGGSYAIALYEMTWNAVSAVETPRLRLLRP